MREEQGGRDITHFKLEANGRVLDSLPPGFAIWRLLPSTCCLPSLPLLCRLKAPDLLVPVSLNGALPSYLMVGGLVVNVLSAPFMFSEYGSVGGSPTGLQDQLWFGVKNETDQQVGAPGRAGLCLASCQGDGRTCWLHQR